MNKAIKVWKSDDAKANTMEAFKEALKLTEEGNNVQLYVSEFSDVESVAREYLHLVDMSQHIFAIHDVNVFTEDEKSLVNFFFPHWEEETSAKIFYHRFKKMSRVAFEDKNSGGILFLNTPKDYLSHWNKVDVTIVDHYDKSILDLEFFAGSEEKFIEGVDNFVTNLVGLTIQQ